MTPQTVTAVYESGILKPLIPLRLFENQVVTITVETQVEPFAEDSLQKWLAVYESLDKSEITEIEMIALDREHFMPPVE